MSWLNYKKKAEDPLIIFLTIIMLVAFGLGFVIASSFPHLPWENLGGLFIYGVTFFGMTIFVIIHYVRKFQKRMIGLQLLTGVVLFVIYFIVITALIKYLPKNTWVYSGIFLIFFVIILFLALFLEYKYIIKKHLKRKRTKIKSKKEEIATEAKKEKDLQLKVAGIIME